MIEKDLAKLQAHAKSRGCKLSRFDGLAYLRSQELLRDNPEHEAALSIVTTVTDYLATRIVPPMNFFMFTLGDVSTTEELAGFKPNYDDEE